MSFNPLFVTYRQGLNQLARSAGTPLLQEVIQNELLGMGEAVESHLSRVFAVLGIVKTLNIRKTSRLTQEDTRDEQLGLDGAAEGFLRQVLRMKGIQLPNVFPQTTPSLKSITKLKS